MNTWNSKSVYSFLKINTHTPRARVYGIFWHSTMLEYGIRPFYSGGRAQVETHVFVCVWLNKTDALFLPIFIYFYILFIYLICLRLRTSWHLDGINSNTRHIFLQGEQEPSSRAQIGQCQAQWQVIWILIKGRRKNKVKGNLGKKMILMKVREESGGKRVKGTIRRLERINYKMLNTLLLQLLPGSPLWPGVVLNLRVLSMGLIELLSQGIITKIKLNYKCLMPIL